MQIYVHTQHIYIVYTQSTHRMGTQTSGYTDGYLSTHTIHSLHTQYKYSVISTIKLIMF